MALTMRDTADYSRKNKKAPRVAGARTVGVNATDYLRANGAPTAIAVEEVVVRRKVGRVHGAIIECGAEKVKDLLAPRHCCGLASSSAEPELPNDGRKRQMGNSGRAAGARRRSNHGSRVRGLCHRRRSRTKARRGVRGARAAGGTRVPDAQPAQRAGRAL